MEVCWVRVHDGVDHRVVVIAGELDVASASQVDAVSRRAVDVIVDVRGMSFVDAAGLGALIRLRRDTQAAGMTCVWRGTPTCLVRVLSVLGLVDTFTFETGRPHREERVRALARRVEASPSP